MQISNVMSKDILTIQEDQNIETVGNLFKKGGKSHVPVVNQSNKLVGIISRQDYLSFLKYLSNETSGKTWSSKQIEYMRVKEIMTQYPETLESTNTVKDAAKFLIRTGYHCIPIVENNKVIGIVTPNDLIKVIIE